MSARSDVCSVEHAWALDVWFRRFLQNPDRIVGPHISEGMTVLDFGCGTGYFTVPMARMVGRTGKVVACDLQADMLDIVRRKVSGTNTEQRVVFHQCAQNSLNLLTPVDFALAFYVVHEVPDKDRLFRELAALLKSDGRLFVIEPPFHVSKAEFARTLRCAEAAGLVVDSIPRVFANKTALLKREPR